MTGRDALSGVTLIEMMVVLAVVGVGTGAVTLGLGTLGRDDRVESAARRLSQDIAMAVDMALIDGKARRVIWDTQGYVITDRVTLDASLALRRGDGLTDAVMIRPDGLGDNTEFVVSGADTSLRIAFDGYSVAVMP